MKKVNKKTLYVSLIAIATAIVIALALFFSSNAYAWLINYVRGNFTIEAGEPDPFTLEIAKVPSGKTETDRVFAPTVDNTNKTIEVTNTETGSALTVSLEDMSFGSIDNVAQLKDENVVYLRLTVPKSLGDTVILNMHYSADDFIVLHKTIYDANWNPTGTEEVKDGVTDANGNTITTIADLLGVENKAGDSFLLYDAVVSNQAYAATDIAANLESTAQNSEPKFDEANYKKFVKDPTAYTITLVNGNYDAVADGDNYYVYIKVVPNLSVFAYSIEYISDIMPCYMYFKISASFESGPNPSPSPKE